MSLIDLILMAFQMVWELILVYPILTVLIIVVALWPWSCVLTRSVSWGAIMNRANMKKAMWRALICGVIAFILLPYAFASSLADLDYFVDWLFNLGSSLSVAAYAFFLFLPICACRCQSKACSLS